MHEKKAKTIAIKQFTLNSQFLDRLVKIDCYFPKHILAPDLLNLLLINDGQNLEELNLEGMLEKMMGTHEIQPLFCVGIHANEHRKMEYGTANCLDYKGLGAKAGAYTHFVLQELIPFIRKEFLIPSFKEKSFAGFSLGGLSALDIVWNHSSEFSKVGVFSGSLWWRTKSLDAGYNEATDRIMHASIKKGKYAPWLKFFFETGVLDETMDRNNNGIIDSIDDTLGLIDELVAKGYHRTHDIAYLELADGKHDIATWARAMPEFLKWGWATKNGENS
jgi:enterochelin esterase-like enzyme